MRTYTDILWFSRWISFLRNLTELKLSVGHPARTITIRAEPDRAKELLDHLLERLAISEPQPDDEREREPGEERDGECESGSESLPEFLRMSSLLDTGRYEYFLE